MNDELRTADPWYDQRPEMRQHEFDAVHFFVNQPGCPPAPRPRLGVYLDSGLSQPALARQLPRLVDDMLAVLGRTTTLPMRPHQAGHALVGRAPVDRWWDAETLGDLAAALETGRAEALSVSVDGPDDEEFWYLSMAALPDRPDAALDLSLVPSHDLWPPEATDTVAETLLDLVVSWTEPLSLLTAAVTYDQSDPQRSPWDHWYGTDHRTTAPVAHDHVRGYFWANLLTSGHLARLGGLDALTDRADREGLSVRRVNEHAAVLRAPGPVGAFDDRGLAAAKTVLGPLLIDHPYICYQGYPLRIVPDPGTAFRRVPPGSPMPRWIP